MNIGDYYDFTFSGENEDLKEISILRLTGISFKGKWLQFVDETSKQKLSVHVNQFPVWVFIAYGVKCSYQFQLHPK